jgi:hypothetical protein
MLAQEWEQQVQPTRVVVVVVEGIQLVVQVVAVS